MEKRDGGIERGRERERVCERGRVVRRQIRHTRIFTTSTRLRPHTWRLGLTALILKNCRLSRSLLPPSADPESFSTGPSFPPPSQSYARPQPTSPVGIFVPPENEIAPFCTVGDKVLGASRHVDPSLHPTSSSRQTAPTTPPWMLKHARVFSSFARSPIARSGLGIAANFEIISKKLFKTRVCSFSFFFFLPSLSFPSPLFLSFWLWFLPLFPPFYHLFFLILKRA